jgi:hypothetical protein
MKPLNRRVDSVAQAIGATHWPQKQMRQLEYKAENRYGVGSTGRTQSTPAELIAILYRRGARWAKVYDDAGHLVAEVTAHPDTGKRIWWAEQ